MLCWISIQFPHLQLDTHYPNWPAQPIAIIDANNVIYCSPLARAAGIRIGMRAGGVSTVCANCKVITLNPQATAQQLQQVATSLMQYTPEVCLSGPNTISLHVSASLRLFGGPRALYRAILKLLSRSAYHVNAAMAPTATGSLLLLHASTRQCRALSFKRLTQLLAPIPCSALQQAQSHLEWLHAIGCTNLASLSALPRKALLRRTSPLLLDELDQALGQKTEAFAFFQPALTFTSSLELYDSVLHASIILHRAQRLIEELCGWLQAHQLALNELTFDLTHERGRHARKPSQLTLRLSSPSWDPVLITQLVGERLQRYPLAAPVVAIALKANDLQARTTQSLNLFPDPQQRAAELAPLFDLLKARLGDNAILEAVPIADHRPEKTNQWLSHPQPKKSQIDLPVGPRPFWLLPTPIALTVHNHRPFYTSALKMISGPERLEEGWWDNDAIARDYFIAEATNGARYWVFQDLKKNGEWYLHGLFA